jgi:hypothetical protein
MPRKSDVDIEPHVERFSWPVFYDWWVWKPDQSVSVVGAIGSGKSTLLVAILPKVPRVVFFGTKPLDPIYTKLEQQGYRRLTHWPRKRPGMGAPDPGPRILLQPPVSNLTDDIDRQKAVFGDALNRIFVDAQEPGNGRVIVVDETHYLVQRLGLGKPYTTVLLQGRALKVPIVAGAQRTSWVPRETWSEVVHVFIFGTRDRRDLLSLRELGGKVDPDIVSAAVMALEQFEALYINRISGRMAIVKAPKVV